MSEGSLYEGLEFSKTDVQGLLHRLIDPFRVAGAYLRGKSSIDDIMEAILDVRTALKVDSVFEEGRRSNKESPTVTEVETRC